MGKITNQDRAAIRRIFEKVKEDTDPKVFALAQTQPLHPEMPNIIAAQNTLRVCLSASIKRSLEEKLGLGMGLKTEWAAPGEMPAPNVPDRGRAN